MAANRSRTSVAGLKPSQTVLACAVGALLLCALTTLGANAQGGGGGPTYQRKGSFAGGWGSHHDKWRHRPMPQFSSQTSFGSFQRPYPYHLDYYRARWGGSYAPYFGNLYGPPNFFFGSPFFGGFNPFWGFGAYPFSGFGAAGFGAGVGGFESPAWGGGPFVDGRGYGPWQGPFNPAMAPMVSPFEGGAAGPAAGF